MTLTHGEVYLLTELLESEQRDAAEKVKRTDYEDVISEQQFFRGYECGISRALNMIKGISKAGLAK